MRRVPVLLAIAGCLFSTAAVQPSKMLHFDFPGWPNQSIDEGNSGTRVIRFGVKMLEDVPLREPVRGTYTAQGSVRQGDTPATGGTTCSPGVDFIAATNQPFTFAAGSSGPFFIDVTICGDTSPEELETIRVVMQGVDCLEKCVAVGQIRNDDGEPPRQCTMQGRSFPCPPDQKRARCKVVNGQLVCI